MFHLPKKKAHRNMNCSVTYSKEKIYKAPREYYIFTDFKQVTNKDEKLISCTKVIKMPLTIGDKIYFRQNSMNKENYIAANYFNVVLFTATYCKQYQCVQTELRTNHICSA